LWSNFPAIYHLSINPKKDLVGGTVTIGSSSDGLEVTLCNDIREDNTKHKILQDNLYHGRLSHRPPCRGTFAMHDRLHCITVTNPGVQIFLKYGPEGGISIGFTETRRVKLEQGKQVYRMV
jgi:hypothetical protein